jgi:hypothetical protein
MHSHGQQHTSSESARPEDFPPPRRWRTTWGTRPNRLAKHPGRGNQGKIGQQIWMWARPLSRGPNSRPRQPNNETVRDSNAREDRAGQAK